MTRRTLFSHGYEAQLFTDSRPGSSHVFHYIITKKDSPSIIGWGQESTEAAAEKAAMEYIRDAHKRAIGEAG